MNTSMGSMLISGSSLKLVARKMCRPSKDTFVFHCFKGPHILLVHAQLSDKSCS